MDEIGVKPVLLKKKTLTTQTKLKSITNIFRDGGGGGERDRERDLCFLKILKFTRIWDVFFELFCLTLIEKTIFEGILI